MSERFSIFNCTDVSMHPRTVALLFGFVSLLLIKTSLATSAVISLERTHATFPGSYEYVNLDLAQSGSAQAFSSFDFLISYDNVALTLISVSPGTLFTGCGWEYFNYTVGAGTGCTNNCPSGLLRISAVASDPGISGDPSCFLDQGDGTLAVLKFLVNNSTTVYCDFLPLRFFWDQCSDNLLTKFGDDSVLVADTVFWGTLFPGEFYPLPAAIGTSEGIPDPCLLTSINGKVPHRGVNFIEGGIDIICPPDPTNRGDLNLNGIPYEVADYLILMNYFASGLPAFTINMQEQIAASDCNADGLVLQFRDLGYLYRVIVGDAIPFPKPSAGGSAVAAFTNNTATKTVSLSTSDPLCLVGMTFTGTVTPVLQTSAEWLNYVHAFGFTLVVVTGEPDHSGLANGLLITYTGDGQLQSAAAVDWVDSDATTTIQIESQSECGDVDGSTATNISDCVYIIAYIFSGGTAPLDEHSGDVNCDGMTTISDAVYLLQYIFAGGPSPCENCP